MSPERFGDFALLEILANDGTSVLWIARAPDGELVELLVLDAALDDIAEAFFRGEELPRFRALTALGDARLPRMLREPLRVDGRNALLFRHAPCVGIGRLIERARDDGGLALPLVCSIARDAAGALAAFHQTGGAGLGLLGVAVDGTARMWSTTTAAPAGDVGALGRRLAILAFGDRALREGVPVPLTALVAWMVQAADRPSAAAVVEALDDDALAWARWTPEQVAAELRALFPDVESRR